MPKIPLRYIPVHAVKVTDPVTGAKYMKKVDFKKPDADFQGYPKSATCRTPYCKNAGLPHDKCKVQQMFDTDYTNPYHYHAHRTYPSLNDPCYVPAPAIRNPYHRGRPVPPVSPVSSDSSEELDSPSDPEPVIPRRYTSRRASDFIPPRPPAPRRPDPVIPERPVSRHSDVFIPPRPSSRQHRPVIPPEPVESQPFSPFIPPRPSPSPLQQSSADENAFQRWLQSFPHWRLPREMPPEWMKASRQGRYARHRAGSDLPRPGPFGPAHAASWQAPNIPPMVSSLSLSGSLPNRVPDRVEWDNVQGGKLQWTPHPWIAHPLPHPQIPANAFWNYPIDHNAQQFYGLDADRVRFLTGGHPLPGMDRYWTPADWAVPLPAQYPRHGILLSPWLVPNARHSFCPHVLWDAAIEPPYKIKRITSRGIITDFASTDFFKTPATYPPVKTLQVNLPHMRNSWGPVVVRRDSDITVGDIFKAVYEYLHTPITHADIWAIFHTYGWERCEIIRWAFHRRCCASGSLYDYTKSEGIKRVDLLQNESIYWGTYVTYNVDWTWSLTMAFVPRTRITK